MYVCAGVGEGAGVDEGVSTAQVQVMMGCRCG